MKIVDIHDDGAVTMKGCGTDGKPNGIQSDIAFSVFSEHYKVIKDSAVMQLANYPDAGPRSSHEFVTMNLKAVVTNALYTLVNAIDGPHVRVQDKPIAAVFAAKAYAKGSLTFVPATLQVAVETNPKNAKPKSGHYAATVEGYGDTRFFLMRSTSKEFVTPIWYLRTTTIEKNANAKVVQKCVACARPSYHGLNEHTNEVTIECVENYKEIAVGDEVVVITKEVKKDDQGKQFMMAIPRDKKRKIGN